MDIFRPCTGPESDSNMGKIIWLSCYIRKTIRNEVYTTISLFKMSQVKKIEGFPPYKQLFGTQLILLRLFLMKMANLHKNQRSFLSQIKNNLYFEMKNQSCECWLFSGSSISDWDCAQAHKKTSPILVSFNRDNIDWTHFYFLKAL